MIPVGQLFLRPDIYVIPTFQRPYAWEKVQREDLRDDIITAAKSPNPWHYFAPIHVIKVASPADPHWQIYVDVKNMWR